MIKLFLGKNLSSALEERMNKAQHEVCFMLGEKSDAEITELAFNRFKIELPTLNLQGSRKNEVTPDTLDFYVPCSGDDFLWDCKPNLYTQFNARHPAPTAEKNCDEKSGTNNVKISIKRQGGISQRQIEEQYKFQINLVQSHLSATCNEVSAYNQEVRR